MSDPITRRRILSIAVAAGAFGSLASCGSDLAIDWNDAACESALNDAENINAFAWFRDPSGGPKRLGAWSNDEGLAFVEVLQSKGAKRVAAVGLSRVNGADPHETARGLVVELPGDATERLSLFRLYAEQVRGQGYRPQGDTGQRYLYLPWKP